MDEECKQGASTYLRTSNDYLQGNGQGAGYLFSGLFLFSIPQFMSSFLSYSLGTVWPRALFSASSTIQHGCLVILRVEHIYTIVFLSPPLVLERDNGQREDVPAARVLTTVILVKR